MSILPPLIDRLVERHGAQLVDGDTQDAILSQPGTTVLFCAGDPVQYRECLDVAVVLPELAAAFPGCFGLAVADPSMAKQLQTLYGFQRWPSLVFLRDGEYLGIISGMVDWQVFLDRVAELLEAPPSRPPSVGIDVANASCQ